MDPLREIFGYRPSHQELIVITDGLKEVGEAEEKKREEFNLTHARCPCKKMMPIANMRIYDTGQIKAIDPVCESCIKTFAKFARIVCKNCRMPEIFVEPHKDAQGFEFVAGRTYHTTACPNCFPKIRVAIPLEKIAFDHRKSGLSMPLKEFMQLCLSKNSL